MTINSAYHGKESRAAVVKVDYQQFPVSLFNRVF